MLSISKAIYLLCALFDVETFRETDNFGQLYCFIYKGNNLKQQMLPIFHLSFISWQGVSR